MHRRFERLRRRFPPRDKLTKSDLAKRFFSGYQEAETIELFDLIEREFHIDIGFLRPEDSLDTLFAPVSSWNPFSWAMFRALESDGVNEISTEVAKKRKRRGLPVVPANEVRTVGDLVHAWCETEKN
jgi:hypothetical protein